MPIPALAASAIRYGPAAYGILKGLFGGKSPQQKAQERLQKIAEQGLDPAILQRAIAILNVRNQGEQSGVLSRLSAGGIDPSSGLAQEAVGATRRSLGARQGEAQSLFNTQSEEAMMRANEQLAGMPEDTSTGDLVASLLSNLDARGVFDKKNPSVLEQSSSIGMQLPDQLPEYSDISRRLNQNLLSPQEKLYQPGNYVTNLRSGGLNQRRKLSPLNPYYRP